MNQSMLDALMSYSRSEVDKLLAQYKEYKELDAAIMSGKAASKPRFSLMGNLGTMQNLDPLAAAKKQLANIGNAMKFQNPLIWLMYKHEAYRNEPEKALKTVSDLVAHCQVDGICHKRFDAINTHLRHATGKDIADTSFQNLSLDDLAHNHDYLEMCLHLPFQKKWSKHENDSTGKWHNYILGSNEPEDMSCC